MRDFRSILNIIGILICIEAVAMLIPMFFDLYYGNYDWLQFFYSSLITFFIGIILYFSFRKKNIKLGICGEHGGDPKSINFCSKTGLNYVSCSPYRVPVARLAAAQAELKK